MDNKNKKSSFWLVDGALIAERAWRWHSVFLLVLGACILAMLINQYMALIVALPYWISISGLIVTSVLGVIFCRSSRRLVMVLTLAALVAFFIFGSRLADLLS